MHDRRSTFPLILTTLAIGLFGGYYIAPRVQLTGPPPLSADEARKLIEGLDDPSKRFAAVAAAVRPAVVHVKVLREDWFSGNDRQLGNGSGVIVSANGLVLTNHHVVNGAPKVAVQLLDGRQLPATVLGSDADTDIAVLKVTGERLPVAPLGDSESLVVGQWVLAIGNPFGIGQTVTSGIVSARGRAGVGINAAEDFIQTDAAINPGNSGGPMVDLTGKVVGINSAIISKSGGYQGIGLAIPINIARSIMKSLAETGEIQRGYMGVSIETVQFTAGPRKGATAVQVKRVEPGSPAANGGVQVDDIILRYAGQPVRSVRHLLGRIAQGNPGQTVQLEVLRGRQTQALTITLGRRALKSR